MTTDIRNKLFAIIRVGMDHDIPFPSLSSDDCKTLLQIGAKQSILPIIHRGLKKAGTPAEVVRECDKARLLDTKQYIIQNDALQKIGIALDEAQIPYIPLKGAVLRKLYPAPELRTSSDIDVLVKEDDVEVAVAVIEKATDLVRRKNNYHDISMVNSQIHLELHFSILENMENIDKLLSQVWDYAVQDEGSRYKLTPEFQIFHVVAHMSYHMVHGGLGIRPFLDLWLLRTKTEYDEDTVRSMCSDCSILTFYEKCCNLVDAWMTGNSVPENLTMFEDYALNGGVFGNKENALASKQREHRGFGYYFYRVFMSRALLETEYPELKERPYLVPICQMKRWLRLLNRKKRKQVRKEIANVRAMKPETIDSFDKLLASLEL